MSRKANVSKESNMLSRGSLNLAINFNISKIRNQILREQQFNKSKHVDHFDPGFQKTKVVGKTPENEKGMLVGGMQQSKHSKLQDLQGFLIPLETRKSQIGQQEMGWGTKCNEFGADKYHA